MFYVFRLKRLVLIALAIIAVLVLLLVLIGREDDSVKTFSESAQQLILVIDPGHGGEDGGAVSSSGDRESAVNLDIALRARALADFLGLENAMTRESEDIDYPDSADTVAARKVWDQHSRAELINSFPSAVMLSIHQNKYPDSRPCGAQVFYASTAGSEDLGRLTHSNLVSCLAPENRRVAAPASKDIYLMRSVSCPAILVECGFLSNPDEAALLRTDAYQKKLSVVMIGSYCQYLQTI